MCENGRAVTGSNQEPGRSARFIRRAGSLVAHATAVLARRAGWRATAAVLSPSDARPRPGPRADRSRARRHVACERNRDAALEPSLYEQLEAAGVLPTRADLTVEATEADATAAQLLEVADGAPLLVTTQTTYDADGRTIEFAVIACRGDRYRHRASLMRPLFPKGEK